MSDKLYLFADNNEGTAENLGSYRLYNMKIEGDSEGVESGVNYVDYIYGDGASWIDTGIAVPTDYRIDIEFMIGNQNNLYNILYGSTGNTLSAYGYSDGTALLSVYHTVYGRYLKWIDEGLGMDIGRMSGNILYDNGVHIDKRLSYSHKVVSPGNLSVYLFATHYTNGANAICESAIRIYDFKIYDNNDTLLIHLRPCVDTEGVPCMYDEVSGEYFHNQGTGTFGYKTELRDFQPVLDSNGIPCLMDKINKKYYYDKNGKGFGCAEQSEYKRVGYIQGDGASYINTNIYANDQYKYEAVLQDNTKDNYESYFGDNNQFRILRFGTSSFMFYHNNAYTMHNGSSSVFDNKITLTINKNICYINQQEVLTRAESSNTTPHQYPIMLFLTRNGGNLDNCGDMKLYSFKMWNENGELVFDGIPVLDNNNIPCMYDLVTETFFYNQGTGTFSYGIEESECPKANYVEYLKAPNVGNQINTGITYDNTYSKIEFKFNTNNCNTSDEILRAGGDRNFWFWIYYGEIRFLNCGYTFENGSNIDIDVTITSTECIINGTTYTYETPLNSVSQNMLLFSYSNWIKLYYFRVYDSEGNLIQDLHPSLDNDKIPCMYDTVSDSYFYSNGNDTFEHGKSIGYTPIKYIETNGTQYIDTGVVPTDNTDIDMKARIIDKPYFQAGWKNSVDLFPNPNVEYILETDIKYLGQQQGSGVVIQTHSWSKFFGITAEGYYSIYDTISTTLASTTSYDKIKIKITNSAILLYVNDELTLEVTNSSVFGAILGGGSSNWALFRTHGVKATSLDGEVLYNCIPVLADTDITLSGNTTTIQGLPRIYEEINGTYTKIHYQDNLNYQEYGGRPNWNYGYDDSYLCNNMTLINVYKQVPYTNSAGGSSTYTIYDKSVYGYKETNTNVEPNLTASASATLTLGSTYSAYLTEAEIEQTLNNGWIIE